jgi:aspartate aminotransferase
MEYLSERIKSLSESQTIAMSKKSRELQEQGIDVINLSLGEPDFNTPNYIKEAAKKAIDNNFSKYPPVAGYKELKQAIKTKFKRDNNLDYDLNQIVVSTGAKQTIANIILCLVNPGDEVIVPTPYWVSYLELIKLAGGIPVFVDSTIETDFKISAEDLEKVISPKSKMIIFSSPSNPTGSVYTESELEALAKVLAKKKDLFIVSDEIYELINFEGQHHSIAKFDIVKEQTITVNGVSKGFAMTGWRIGYMGAPKAIADACEKMQGQFTSGACSIAQKAAETALTESSEEIEVMKTAFKKRRDLLNNLLSDVKGVKTYSPQGAFYLFPDISFYFGKKFENTTIGNASDLCMFLLEKGHVAAVPGEAFGTPSCLRISYATSEDKIIEAVKRIKKTFELLK